MSSTAKPAPVERERQTGPAVWQVLRIEGKRCHVCKRPMTAGERVLRIPMLVRNGKYRHEENRAFGTCCAPKKEG